MTPAAVADLADPIVIHVIGLPAPQGSKRVANARNGRAILLDGGSAVGAKKTSEWRQAVGWSARQACAGRPPMDGCIELKIRFVLPRPKSTRKGTHWHNTRPDCDKLVRASGDALTESGAITDDARIVRIVAEKVLADPADPWTGAVIILRQLDPRGAAA